MSARALRSMLQLSSIRYAMPEELSIWRRTFWCLRMGGSMSISGAFMTRCPSVSAPRLPRQTVCFQPPCTPCRTCMQLSCRRLRSHETCTPACNYIPADIHPEQCAHGSGKLHTRHACARWILSHFRGVKAACSPHLLQRSFMHPGACDIHTVSQQVSRPDPRCIVNL